MAQLGPDGPTGVSVHHPRVAVVLELQEVVERISQHEGEVFLRQALEPSGDLLE